VTLHLQLYFWKFFNKQPHKLIPSSRWSVQISFKHSIQRNTSQHPRARYEDTREWITNQAQTISRKIIESRKERFDEQDQLAQYLATPIGIILAVKTLQAKCGRDKRGSHEHTIQKGKGTKAYASAHPNRSTKSPDGPKHAASPIPYPYRYNTLAKLAVKEKKIPRERPEYTNTKRRCLHIQSCFRVSLCLDSCFTPLRRCWHQFVILIKKRLAFRPAIRASFIFLSPKSFNFIIRPPTHSYYSATLCAAPLPLGAPPLPLKPPLPRPNPLPRPRPLNPPLYPSTLPCPKVSRFFLRSSLLNSCPPSLRDSSRSFSSDEILSKKLVLLLYEAAAGMITSPFSDSAGLSTSSVPFAAWPLVAVLEVGGAAMSPPSGEPDAMASLARSCLLNFAFADSKSKSVAGTSIFSTGCALCGCAPLPPLPPRPAPR